MRYSFISEITVFIFKSKIFLWVYLYLFFAIRNSAKIENEMANVFFYLLIINLIKAIMIIFFFNFHLLIEDFAVSYISNFKYLHWAMFYNYITIHLNIFHWYFCFWHFLGIFNY